MDLIAIGLSVWSRLLMRRPDAPSWLRWVAPALVLGFLVSLVGTGLGLMWAFRAVETVPADQKASVLSANIARAMWFTLIGFVFDAIALVALLVVTFGRRSTR